MDGKAVIKQEVMEVEDRKMVIKQEVEVEDVNYGKMVIKQEVMEVEEEKELPWWIRDKPNEAKTPKMAKKVKKIPHALFDVDEKVLCYEPDPTKAKVLYDSKVLEVVERKEKGKKSIEYRVHFQGWNSSWDRFVGEKYILKRDDENLTLQDELREKAKVLNDALKIKKKKTSSLSDLIRASMEKNSNGNEDGSANGSTSGESLEDLSDDEGCKESVPIVVPETIKRRLEDDYYFINEDQQLVQIPAKLNIVQILEDYVKHYGLSALAAWIDTMRSRPLIPTPPNSTCPTPSIASTSAASSSKTLVAITKGAAVLPLNLLMEEKIEPDELLPVIQRVQLVKEVVEGVRVMFDFLINQILLYKEEMEQFKSVIHLKPQESVSKIKVSDYVPDDYMTKSDYEHDQSSDTSSDEPSVKKMRFGSKTPKRTCTIIPPLFCTDVTPHSYSGSSLESPPLAICYKPKGKSYLQLYQQRIEHYIKTLMEWKLIPTSSDPEDGEQVKEEEASPCYMYGSVHLLRLFVKLPNILSQANMPKKRLSIVVQLLNQFIQYLSRQDADHSLYMPAKQFSEEVSSDEEESTPTPNTPKKGWKARSFTK